MQRTGADKLRMLAFDLGASNGRAMLGTLENGKLNLEEAYRFPNEPIHRKGHWCWDIPKLLSHIESAIRTALAGSNRALDSLGIDSWGVDYGLIDTSGNLTAEPRHYRDEQTEGMREAAFSRMPREELFRETGNAFERYNTLYQLLGMVAEGSGILDRSESLLLIADLFVFLLTGSKRSEFTAATTTQLVKIGSSEWNSRILTTMGIPQRLFTPIDLPGAVRGELRTPKEVRSQSVPVVSVGHHDTASAVAGIPGLQTGHAFLSSGTWSLIGMEVARPVLSIQAMQFGYTNEGRVDGGYRLLQNIMGLWILQECKRAWDQEGGTTSFEELSILAENAPPFTSFIDPANGIFFPPGEMSERIERFCRRSGQTIPPDRPAIVRCVLESLALKYRTAIEHLEQVTGVKVEVLHVVGGGSRNRVLNQFTANSLARPVVAGPEESAALGNIAMQAVTLGVFSDLAEGRKVIGESVHCDEYLPGDVTAWDDAYGRFRRLCNLEDLK